MNLFARLKDGALAGVAGWLAGWLISFPFEFSLAWRYVDGNVRMLPRTLAEGMVVWAAFSLFMGLAGFIPLLLPLVLLLPPQWIVRGRHVLIPLAPVVGELAIDSRMGLLNAYHLEHTEDLRAFFLTAPNFFVLAFSLVMVWVYVRLAQRRLRRNHLTGGTA